MAKKDTSNEGKPIKENYIKLTESILALPNLSIQEKVLLAHIGSFGVKGCWQSNRTLGEKFGVDQRTISRWVGKLKSEDHLLWNHPKGYYRCLWAKAHPKVRNADTLLSMGGKPISKTDVARARRRKAPQRRHCPGSQDAVVAPPTTNRPRRVRQDCRETISTISSANSNSRPKENREDSFNARQNENSISISTSKGCAPDISTSTSISKEPPSASPAPLPNKQAPEAPAELDESRARTIDPRQTAHAPADKPYAPLPEVEKRQRVKDQKMALGIP